MAEFNISDMLINLSDYKLNKIIGRGGFGVVFEATEKKTGKTVAIKVILITGVLSTQMGQRELIRELTVPHKVKFGGIVNLIGFRFPLTESEKKTETFTKIEMRNEAKKKDETFDLTGAIFVSEYMPNGSLERTTFQYLKNKGKVEDGFMNPTIRSKILYGIASTMSKIHQKNVIHRDIKLENIFLDDNYEPRIADFGLSKVILDNDPAVTLNIGTPQFMATELFMNTGEKYDLSVDVYAYAFVIYRMFSITIIFQNGRRLPPNEFMMKIAKGQRPVKPESIPDCYWNLIQKCWDQAPENRPKFSEIVELMKDDKFAINEFGMETDLDELHEYQNRVDKDEVAEVDYHHIIELKPEQKWSNRKKIFNWSRH